MARQLIIDRFEGPYAICEEVTETGKQESSKPGKKPGKNAKDLRFFGIEKAELPENAGEGTVLRIDDEGTLSVDDEATKARRAKLQAMQDGLWAK